MTLLVAAIGAALLRPPLPYLVKATGASSSGIRRARRVPLWFQFFGPQRAAAASSRQTCT